MSCPALVTAFVLLRANSKLSCQYFPSTEAHCHVLGLAGSYSSSAAKWGEWGREAQRHHVPLQGGWRRLPAALGPPFCATAMAFEAVLSPLWHAWVLMCVFTTPFIVVSLKYHPPTLWALSFAVWGAPERRSRHGSRGPGSDSCNAMCPQAGWSPLHRQACRGVARCTWAFLRSGISQQGGSGILSQLCCL